MKNMEGKKIAIRSTHIEPWKDRSIYWRFGYFKDGKVHCVKNNSEGSIINIVEGMIAVGFDEPSINTPIWDELTGLVYEFVERTTYSVNVMEDYDNEKIYNGMHCVKAS